MEKIEDKVSQFKIMYKRPGSGSYETLSETLDYLHKKWYNETKSEVN